MTLKKFFSNAATVSGITIIPTSLLGGFMPSAEMVYKILFFTFLITSTVPFFIALKLTGKKKVIKATLGCSAIFAVSSIAGLLLTTEVFDLTPKDHIILMLFIILLIQTALWYLFFKKDGTKVIISLSATSIIILLSWFFIFQTF